MKVCPCSCRCCSCRAFASILALVSAVLAGLCYKAALEVQEGLSYEPFPTAAELASEGGEYFEGRPSDGGRLEWFSYGSRQPNATTWVVVHGSMNTGQMLSLFPSFDSHMRDLNVRVVAPTMPGWGASDPYKPTFGLASHAWLARWRLDAMALVDHLGVGKLWVSGMSLGGPPGIALAEAAQRQGRLLGQAPTIASMWSHGQWDMRTSQSGANRLVTRLLANAYVGSAVAHYLLRPIILGTTEWARPVDTVDWDAKVWGGTMQRSLRYQLSGFVQSSNLVYQTGGPDLIDWSVFAKDVPITIFYGDRDEQLPASVATFAATKLPWARLVEHAGGHFELDLVKVAKELFAGSA